MKRWMLSVVAAAALAAGGAASAQDVLGTVLPQILGNIGLGNGIGRPGIVNPDGNGSVYVDPVGRRYQYDQYGRLTGAEQLEVVVDKEGRRWAVDSEGRHTLIGQGYGGVAGLDNRAFSNRAFGNRDRDRDGIPDAYDRYPYDPRFR